MLCRIFSALPIIKDERSATMNQEQFKAFWIQLKPSLKVQWEKITEEDLHEIDGNLVAN